MNVTFAYDPRKEVDTLRVGFSSQNSGTPTPFAEEAQAAGIDFTSEEQVATFSLAKIARENIDTAAYAQTFTEQWKPIEQEATDRFKRIFQTVWEPGDVTAYLTLSTRCPYNFKHRYYFVTIGKEKKTPIQLSLHELTHFYTHQLLEPLFVEAGIPTKHNDFKEALTVLLNSEFKDLLDNEDRGYPQHQELREKITESWKAGKDLYTITKEYIERNINS